MDEFISSSCLSDVSREAIDDKDPRGINSERSELIKS